jgi:8-oxo-dGTP pyrophosphatase MutT (NUDIX family)
VTAEELRARLTGLPGLDAPHDIFAPRLDDPTDPFDGKLAEAAVLVPIVLRPEPGVLLTKRTAHLSKHAGQVSFPGGRIDPEDAHPEAAALREAEEEIGLDPAEVELIGRMPTYVTGTGYRITPVLGLVRSDLKFVPSPHEVDAVFELPFSVLLDPAAPRREMHRSGGRMREYWVWPHPEHFVWGATAAILVHLARRLRGEA